MAGLPQCTWGQWQTTPHCCSINNDFPVRIPSHLYVPVNRSVLCNCGIKLENNFLLSLAACHDSNSKLVIYFIVNIAFVNYMDQIHNLTETLEFPIQKNKTTFEQHLPTYLNVSKFDSELLTAPRTLKDFIHQYNYKKFLIWPKGMITWTEIYLTNISFLTIS